MCRNKLSVLEYKDFSVDFEYFYVEICHILPCWIKIKMQQQTEVLSCFSVMVKNRYLAKIRWNKKKLTASCNTPFASSGECIFAYCFPSVHFSTTLRLQLSWLKWVQCGRSRVRSPWPQHTKRYIQMVPVDTSLSVQNPRHIWRSISSGLGRKVSREIFIIGYKKGYNYYNLIIRACDKISKLPCVMFHYCNEQVSTDYLNAVINCMSLKGKSIHRLSDIMKYLLNLQLHLHNCTQIAKYHISKWPWQNQREITNWLKWEKVRHSINHLIK